MFSTSLIKKKSYLCAQFTRTRNYVKDMSPLQTKNH